MISAPARYLLRVDDLCPTISRDRWSRVRELIAEFRLQPILAVVPDNQDPDLRVSPPDSSFWSQLRLLESAGATIGLHGYRHLCLSRGRSLFSLQRTSEFAGVPPGTQRAWIRQGLHILREHGLDPRVFIAPRHGFDDNTLAALRAESVSLLSDGFARVPFLRSGLICIPQQLWAPVDKPGGVWTICIHPNTIRDGEIAVLRRFLSAHCGDFISVDRLLACQTFAPLAFFESAQAEFALRRMLISRSLREIRRSFALLSSNSS